MARRARLRTSLLLFLFLTLATLASVPTTATGRTWHDASGPSILLALPSEPSESVLVRPSIDPLPAGVIATVAVLASLRAHEAAPEALDAPGRGPGASARLLPRRTLSPDDSDPH